MSSANYAPQESYLDLWIERFTFAGGIIGGVAYDALPLRSLGS